MNYKEITQAIRDANNTRLESKTFVDHRPTWTFIGIMFDANGLARDCGLHVVVEGELPHLRECGIPSYRFSATRCSRVKGDTGPRPGIFQRIPHGEKLIRHA